MNTFKTRTLHKYSSSPVYEALYYERAGKGWTILTRPDGVAAKFSQEPKTLEEAKRAIELWQNIQGELDV